MSCLEWRGTRLSRFWFVMPTSHHEWICEFVMKPSELQQKSLHKPVSASYGAFSGVTHFGHFRLLSLRKSELPLLRTATNAP